MKQHNLTARAFEVNTNRVMVQLEDKFSLNPESVSQNPNQRLLLLTSDPNVQIPSEDISRYI